MKSSVDTYLQALPHGLESHPFCRIRSDMVEDARRHILSKLPIGELQKRGVPAALVTVLGAPWPKWIPEVVGDAIVMLYRDVCFADDVGFLADAYEYNLKVLSTPVNRVLFAVLSPSLVVTGAAKRWSTMHQGSHLWLRRNDRKGDRAICELELTYPDGLFPPLMIAAFAQAFRAAAKLSGGESPQAELLDPHPNRALFKVTWDQAARASQRSNASNE